jgi:hypothetical protein
MNPTSLAGRYDIPIPTQCLAPIDCLKIPALVSFMRCAVHVWEMVQRPLGSGRIYV